MKPEPCLVYGCPRLRAEADKSFCVPHREYFSRELRDPYYRDHAVPEMARDGSFRRRLGLA